MKYQRILSLITLLNISMFSPAKAMNMDDEKYPYRFGPIQITEPLTDNDRQEVETFMEKFRQQLPGIDHSSLRTLIAKAVCCGHDAEQFFETSISLDDYYLLQYLLQHDETPIPMSKNI